MKIFKRVLVGVLVVVLIGVIGLAAWGNDAYPPLQPALDALRSDDRVVVTQHEGFITFEPVGVQPATGFVFVPGGRVDYRVYSPALHQIAAQGYFVAVVKVRINLAFFDLNAPERVISQYPNIQHWVIGGHSLGGVAAASYVSKQLDAVDGLVIWASYPGDASLKNTDIKSLTIYGTNNVDVDAGIALARSRLPDSAQFIMIEGGNHAQFGSYGPQAGDNAADISAEEQWAQAVSATVQFLETVSK